MSTPRNSTCPECGVGFHDEHGHGVCFGCKIKGITFGSVPNMELGLGSRFAQDAENLADAKANGIEVGTGVPKVTRKKTEFKLSDELKREIYQFTDHRDRHKSEATA